VKREIKREFELRKYRNVERNVDLGSTPVAWASEWGARTFRNIKYVNSGLFADLWPDRPLL
jgi:hypothetical protein